MKRQEYNFPSPRRERLTQVSLPDDDLMLAPFLEVDQSSVSVYVSYVRSLPKKMKVGEKFPLIIEREPEVYEKDPVILEEMVREVKEEVEEPKSITKLVVKRRDVKVKEIRPSSRLVEKVGEPLEILPSYDRISVVMGFRERDDDRLDALKKCIKSFREQTIDCYLILVEQDNTPLHQTELEPLVDSYLFTYSDDLFNRGWAFNCGAIIAPDDLILLHDCDLLVPKNYVKESIKILGTRDMALPWAKILYLTEDSSKKYPGGNPKISSVVTSQQAVGGSLIIRKNFYLRIGGMDERFWGWGGEDNAFYSKACKLGRISRASPVTGLNLLHHYHKRAPRGHHHIQINNNMQGEYRRMSAHDICDQVEKLRYIGDPLMHQPTEKGQIREDFSTGESMEEVKRVSFALVFRGPERLVGLRKGIESIRKQTVPSYIILVEQDRSPLFRKEIEPLVDNYLFIYSQNLFNHGWAFNCAVLAAPDELIMMHDVDVILPPNYVKDAITLLESADLALPWAKGLFLDEESSRRYPVGPMRTNLVADNSWSCGLSLLVRKSFYLNIGGMDERFEGWGPSDKAFFAKACQLGRVKKASLTSGPTIFHHYHKEDPSVHSHMHINDRIFQEYHNKSDAAIRDMVKELGPIGSISKYLEPGKANR